jgi:hypothetical protein
MTPDASAAPDTDVSSLALILYELLVGEPAARSGAAMDAAGRRIINQGWSVGPELRGIFDALRGISFRLTAAVNPDRAAQSLALAAPPAITAKGRRHFPRLHRRRTVEQRDLEVPDGIISHLTRECGGNVVEVPGRPTAQGH